MRPESIGQLARHLPKRFASNPKQQFCQYSTRSKFEGKVSMSTTLKSKKKSTTNLQPLGDRLVAQRAESEQKTTGGIYLPDTARDKPTRGVVISVGEGRLSKNGSRVPLQVKPGDQILFTSYGPEEFKVGDEEYLLLSENDVLAVLE
jgi:chaperonin GroES